MNERGGAPGGTRNLLTLLRSNLVGAFGVMMAAVTIAGVLNYVFSIIMTRMLGETGAFSNFNSLNSLFLIVTMGALAFQTLITKYVAEFTALGESDKIRALIREFARWLIFAGVAVMALSLAAAWPVSSLLKLGSPLYLVVVGSSVGVALFMTIPNGLLQGQQRFIGLGLASVSNATLRIVIGVALVALGAGVYGALGAATLAGILVGGVIIYYYRDMFRGTVVPVEGFHPGKAMWALVPVAAAVFLFIFMTQVDVILVKALETAAQADRYSYGALAGKAVLFFPGGIALVMFPRVSALRAEGKPTRRILYYSLAACLVIETAVVGFYALFPGFTSSFFAGKRGGDLVRITGFLGIKFVVLFGMVMAVFAFLNLLVYYQLALDGRAFIAVLGVGAAVQVAGILLFHDTLPEVLLVMLVVGTVVLVINLALAFRSEPVAPGGPAAADSTTLGEVSLIYEEGTPI